MALTLDSQDSIPQGFAVTGSRGPYSVCHQWAWSAHWPHLRLLTKQRLPPESRAHWVGQRPALVGLAETASRKMCNMGQSAPLSHLRSLAWQTLPPGSCAHWAGRCRQRGLGTAGAGSLRRPGRQCMLPRSRHAQPCPPAVMHKRVLPLAPQVQSKNKQATLT